MVSIQDNKDCCGCNACVQRCPKQCITMVEDSEGFLYPKVDREHCVDCGLCNRVCPVINQGIIGQPIEVYAAKNPHEEIRRQSSSGGIFTMLAEYTIDNGGVVFGAAFNEKWEVEHNYTETKEGISAFRGSKYVQSRIGETFTQVETFLKQGREVLFSGTPCQIAGLKLFLGKDYENLLTVDIICHGVPSPKVFRDFLDESLENASRQYHVATNDILIDHISFRDKSCGWRAYQFVLNVHIKGMQIPLFAEKTSKNPYLRGFSSNLYLRPSCYDCPTKELKSGSDITIADYWGIEHYKPELDDNKGISAILVNTRKGKEVVSKLNVELYILTYESIRQYNASIYYSPQISSKRKEFFTPSNETFSSKIERLCGLTFWEHVRRRMSFVKHELWSRIKK